MALKRIKVRDKKTGRTITKWKDTVTGKVTLTRPILGEGKMSRIGNLPKVDPKNKQKIDFGKGKMSILGPIPETKSMEKNKRQQANIAAANKARRERKSANIPPQEGMYNNPDYGKDTFTQGVGPVKSGKQYNKDLKKTTQGIGPTKDGEKYAENLKLKPVTKKDQEADTVTNKKGIKETMKEWGERTKNSPAAKSGAFSLEERWNMHKKHQEWLKKRAKKAVIPKIFKKIGG